MPDSRRVETGTEFVTADVEDAVLSGRGVGRSSCVSWQRPRSRSRSSGKKRGGGPPSRVDVFREQAASLVAGGVDLIWIETMSDLNEMKAAIQGVRAAAPAIALIATMTFDTRGYTMMGVSPEDAVTHLAAWGADAVGGNCGNGPDELIPVIAKMHAAAPGVVLVAKSNAGVPELVDMRAVYRADPATMADDARQMQAAGARIVGGCCGSTPDHLRAIAAAIGASATATAR